MAGAALKSCFKEIGDAIREKLRINTLMAPIDMPSYIDLIETREIDRPICDLKKLYEERSDVICVLNQMVPIIDYENDRIFFWDSNYNSLDLYTFTENSITKFYVSHPKRESIFAQPKQVFLVGNILYYIPENTSTFTYTVEGAAGELYYEYYYTTTLPEPEDMHLYIVGSIFYPSWSEHSSQWAYELEQKQYYYSVQGNQYSTVWKNNCFINSYNNYAYFLKTAFRYSSTSEHEEIYTNNGIKIPLSTSYEGSLISCNVSIEEGINIYDCINGYNIYYNIYNQEPVFCYPNNTILKLDVTNNNIRIYTLTSFENLRGWNSDYIPSIISEYLDNNNTKHIIKLDNCLNKLINNIWYVDMILPVFKEEYPYFLISTGSEDIALEDNFFQINHMPNSKDNSTIRRLYYLKNAGTFCFISTKYLNQYGWLRDLIIYKIIDKEV